MGISKRQETVRWHSARACALHGARRRFDDALPQTAAWPASTSAAFMMPPMPKAGAIRIPKATTVAGATRQTSRIRSAT